MKELFDEIKSRAEDCKERSGFHENQHKWEEADFYSGKASAFEEVLILLNKVPKPKKIDAYLKQIADHYGLENQTDKCKEELHELIEALNGGDPHLAEEIADVEIMIAQIKYLRNLLDERIDGIKQYKIERQLQRIENGDGAGYVKPTQDVIKSPSHYKLDGLDVESINVIKAVLGEDGFKAHCRGCALKYLLRADKKNRTEDLKKARVYLNWEIEYGCDN